METLLAFGFAFAVTFYFVRSYVKGIAGGASAGAGSASASSGPTKPCPRCSAPVPAGERFCGKCGAPLELWKVHRAAIATPRTDSDKDEKGAPRPVINASLCIGCGTCVDVCPENGALAVVSGKAILAQPEKCTGHAKCVDACPTSGIVMAYGDVLQTVKVPLVNESFETNVSGVYIVGELGGMGLIKTAINEGRLVVDYVQKQLQPEAEAPSCCTNKDGEPCDFDSGSPEIPTPLNGATGKRETPAEIIIVGAGPAGLSAALTAKQQRLNYLVFDQSEVASTIKQYPRHKFLMAEPVAMPLYGNLYIADGTKESLVSVWENIIANTGVKVRTEERVDNVCREGDLLEVRTAQGAYYGKSVVLAMGKRGTPRRLGAPGEDKAKVAYRLIEAETFDDKDILVVGGGDSAIEAALALSRSKRNRVSISYRKDDFSRARDRNQQFLAEAEKGGLIEILRSSTVAEIEDASVKLITKVGERTIPNDFVFVMIGGESPENFLRQIGVEIVEKTVTA